MAAVNGEHSEPERPNWTGDVDEAASLEEVGAGSSQPRLYLCLVCMDLVAGDEFTVLVECRHGCCTLCLREYMTFEVNESRVWLRCPICSEPIDAATVRRLLADRPVALEKYEMFTLRWALVRDPDTRWCPAPDCGYAVIAAGCRTCPRLECGRPDCRTAFCYRCRSAWHPGRDCNGPSTAFSAPPVASGSSRTASLAPGSSGDRGGIAAATSHGQVVTKRCPVCQAAVVKQAGTCNRMSCALCGADFCWLCVRPINDMHYLSPSGCTLFGTRPWSRRRRMTLRLALLLLGPLLVLLLAAASVPVVCIGLPLATGRALDRHLRDSDACQRAALTAAGVVLTALVSPALSLTVVGVGAPLGLVFLYVAVFYAILTDHHSVGDLTNNAATPANASAVV